MKQMSKVAAVEFIHESGDWQFFKDEDYAKMKRALKALGLSRDEQIEALDRMALASFREENKEYKQ